MTEPWAGGTSALSQTVAVTGASGYIGARLVERLLEESGVQNVVGIDLKPSVIENDRYVHIQQDIGLPLESVLASAQVDVVVHLAFVLRQLRRREEARQINVGGASHLLRACASAGVNRIVLMSTTTVYGPRPTNSDDLSEDEALRPPAGFAYAEDKAACEEAFRAFENENPRRQVSILRGCVVMGPRASNFITEALDRPLLIGVRGADPGLQFIHEDDLIEVLTRFVTERHPGTFNVAGPGTLRWSEVAAKAGKRIISLPASLAYFVVGLTWLTRIQNESPSSGLDFIRWPWAVSTSKLQGELSYEFKYSSQEAYASYIASHDSKLGQQAQ